MIKYVLDIECLFYIRSTLKHTHTYKKTHFHSLKKKKKYSDGKFWNFPSKLKLESICEFVQDSRKHWTVLHVLFRLRIYFDLWNQEAAKREKIIDMNQTHTGLIKSNRENITNHILLAMKFITFLYKRNRIKLIVKKT